jgi:hypothetical protein
VPGLHADDLWTPEEMIRIVNKKHASPSEVQLGHYVGRGTALGNPFKVKPWGPYEKGTTLPLYEEWLRQQIAERNVEVIDMLNRLARYAKKGDLILVCHCVDEKGNGVCHAQIIQQILEEKLT